MTIHFGFISKTVHYWAVKFIISQLKPQDFYIDTYPFFISNDYRIFIYLFFFLGKKPCLPLLAVSML